MTLELLRPFTSHKTLSLYPFQEEAIESLRVVLRSGKQRVILCAPTGSGKTEMAIHLIQEAQAKGSRVTFVVDGISLAKQTSDRLWSYGIEHGYAQGENTWGREEKIQVAMAQTIEKRGFWTDLNLLIIDECHIQRKEIQKFAREWGGTVIGLSATPIVKGLRETRVSLVEIARRSYGDASTVARALEQGAQTRRRRREHHSRTGSQTPEVPGPAGTEPEQRPRLCNGTTEPDS